MKNPALRTWHPLAHSGITESSQSVLWAVGAWDTTKNYMLWMWRWRGTCPALLCSHHHQYCVVITPAESRHGYRGGRGTEERSHQGGDVWSWRSNWKGGDEGEGRWTRAGVHSEPATLWWPPSPMSTWWIPCGSWARCLRRVQNPMGDRTGVWSPMATSWSAGPLSLLQRDGVPPGGAAAGPWEDFEWHPMTPQVVIFTWCAVEARGLKYDHGPWDGIGRFWEGNTQTGVIIP